MDVMRNTDWSYLAPILLFQNYDLVDGNKNDDSIIVTFFYRAPSSDYWLATQPAFGWWLDLMSGTCRRLPLSCPFTTSAVKWVGTRLSTWTSGMSCVKVEPPQSTVSSPLFSTFRKGEPKNHLYLGPSHKPTLLKPNSSPLFLMDLKTGELWNWSYYRFQIIQWN